MLSICSSFVDNLEFKERSYRGYATEKLLTRFLSEEKTEAAKLNMAIYVLVRDARLLELRPKLEQSTATLHNPAFRGRQVQFLFKICQAEESKLGGSQQPVRLDFGKCLAKIREMQSDVYIPLSKAAKALGLVQSTHFSYQTIETAKQS